MLLNDQAERLIQFRAFPLLSGGRVRNPSYHPDAEALKGIHAIGKGKVRTIPLGKVISPQATVLGKRTRKMKEAILAGAKSKSLPTVQKVGDRYVVHDGNHRIAAAMKARKNSIRARVQ